MAKRTVKKTVTKSGVVKRVIVRNEKQKQLLVLAAGQQTFQEFFSKHRDLFNMTELERICGTPAGTLRHIAKGDRICSRQLYVKLQEKILPKLCEMVFILQNYSGQMIQREINWQEDKK